MSRKSMKDSTENVFQTLKGNTSGRNEELNSLMRLIHSFEGGASIGIDGYWGTGKTFFVKQLKMMLDSVNTTSEFFEQNIAYANEVQLAISSDIREKIMGKYVTVYYDAWKNDVDEEPVFSLVMEMLVQLKHGELKEKEKDYVGAVLDSAKLIGIDGLKDIRDSLKGDSFLETVKRRRDIENRIKEYIDSLLDEHGEKLVIIIDELDRCCPTYAIKMLERIKHYFDLENVIFVFSFNRKELKHTIRKVYGEGFDANRYLDRFFDVSFTLNELDEGHMNELCQSIRSQDGERFDIGCSLRFVIREYGITLRELGKYIEDVENINSQLPTKLQYGGASTCMLFSYIFVPVAIGLRLTNVDEYNSFLCGKGWSYVQDLLDELKSQDTGRLYGLYSRWIANDDEIYINLNKIYGAFFRGEFEDGGRYFKMGDISFVKKEVDSVIDMFDSIEKYGLDK